MRQGKEITKTVKLGRLEDNEKQKTDETAKAEDDVKPPVAAGVVQKALGMEFSSLDDGARQKYAIKPGVASGVVVTNVDPDSGAAEKRILPGEIIMEVNQEPVKEPADVVGKIDALKKDGKKSALLLVANAQGEMRFVALSFP